MNKKNAIFVVAQLQENMVYKKENNAISAQLVIGISREGKS